MPEDLYDILGIDKDADPKEIKDAYREKAKETHPDKEGGSKEKFELVHHAYAVLSDPLKKERYDKTGDGDQDGMNFEARLGNFFGMYLFRIVASISVDPRQIRNRDVKEKFLKTAELCINEQRENLAKIKAEMKKVDMMKEFLGRFDSPKSPQLKRMFEVEIKRNSQKLELDKLKTEDEIEFLNKVIELLKHTSYKFDMEEPKTKTDQGFTFTIKSWGVDM